MRIKDDEYFKFLMLSPTPLVNRLTIWNKYHIIFANLALKKGPMPLT